MSQVACEVHASGADDRCVDCVKEQRDFYREEAESFMKMLETPESKLFEDEVDPFIAKMKERGVTQISDPAVRYHLALLVKRLKKDHK